VLINSSAFHISKAVATRYIGHILQIKENYFIGNHSSILEKTTYPGSRKLLHSDDPLRIDTAFHSAKPEKGSQQTYHARRKGYSTIPRRNIDESAVKHNNQTLYSIL
jgi:hypothetical protein